MIKKKFNTPMHTRDVEWSPFWGLLGTESLQIFRSYSSWRFTGILIKRATKRVPYLIEKTHIENADTSFK